MLSKSSQLWNNLKKKQRKKFILRRFAKNLKFNRNGDEDVRKYKLRHIVWNLNLRNNLESNLARHNIVEYIHTIEYSM